MKQPLQAGGVTLLERFPLAENQGPPQKGWMPGDAHHILEPVFSLVPPPDKGLAVLAKNTRDLTDSLL